MSWGLYCNSGPILNHKKGFKCKTTFDFLTVVGVCDAEIMTKLASLDISAIFFKTKQQNVCQGAWLAANNLLHKK